MTVREHILIAVTDGLNGMSEALAAIIKTRGHSPTDEAATKRIWLALRTLGRRWTMPIRPWSEAMAPLENRTERGFLTAPTRIAI